MPLSFLSEDLGALNPCLSVSVLLLSDSVCGLGKVDVNSPQHCVNKEQFDQNVI